MQFADEDNHNLCGNVYARWSGKAQIRNYPEASEPRTHELRGDSSRYRLDVAFLWPEDGEIYVINEENQFEGWLMRPLGHGPVLVDVRARGSTAGPPIDQSARFRMSKTNDGMDLVLEPLTN